MLGKPAYKTVTLSGAPSPIQVSLGGAHAHSCDQTTATSAAAVALKPSWAVSNECVQSSLLSRLHQTPDTDGPPFCAGGTAECSPPAHCEAFIPLVSSHMWSSRNEIIALARQTISRIG